MKILFVKFNIYYDPIELNREIKIDYVKHKILLVKIILCLILIYSIYIILNNYMIKLSIKFLKNLTMYKNVWKS